ncbi:SMP-30/gluconolactonase/LRE family protein [Flindersiella endophytica]
MKIKAVWERRDERFARVDGDEYLEVLFDDGDWVEGPAYFPAGRYLLFSDIPNDRLLRWDETSGEVGVFREPAGYTNGHTVDRAGRLLSCEQGGRRVSRTEPDGTVTTVADSWDGKRLNSPNDVVEHSDGSIWFTDPSYGIDSDYEGHRADSEIGACHVYRVAPDGEVHVVADDFVRPNGLAFTADEQELFVVDTRQKHIHRFGVGKDSKDSKDGKDGKGGKGGKGGNGELEDRGVFRVCESGSFDGARFGDQDTCRTVDLFSCSLVEQNYRGATPTAACGARPTTACTASTVVTATTTVYRIRLNVTGARYPI